MAPAVDLVLQRAVMDRDDVLNVRIPANVKSALRDAAADDRRTMSALLEIIVSDWLTERGYLKAARPTPKKKGR
jgi:hypothetical protein